MLKVLDGTINANLKKRIFLRVYNFYDCVSAKNFNNNLLVLPGFHAIYILVCM